MAFILGRQLPEPLLALNDLANDLRWTWSHAGDQLWRSIDAHTWRLTGNPCTILQTTEDSRFEILSKDKNFLGQLRWLSKEREEYLGRQGWYRQHYRTSSLQRVAYFCMEYGLGEALPLYAGGLGILAGDFLKAASDLCVPVVAVGLLFDQGFFRQVLDNNGWQQEMYPNVDIANSPITPALDPSGEWLQVSIELPGRILLLRVWQVKIGGVDLYLLDSNHPQNSVADQAITNQLYPSQIETRFLQQWVLGIAGWRVFEALDIVVDVCHMNEAYSAFAILSRIEEVMKNQHLDFELAMLTIRAGNVLTVHTRVAAAFESFTVDLVEKYLAVFAERIGISVHKLLKIGLSVSGDDRGKFSPIKLALEGSAVVNAVSQSHCRVVQCAFQSEYPRWPVAEVPISCITNGVHVPSWDSAWADKLWTDAAGKERWLGDLSLLPQTIGQQSDVCLWAFKCKEREELVEYIRARFLIQETQQGANSADVRAAENVLDSNALTLGLARRFTEYKRPNLLLTDKPRFARLLTCRDAPLQIIVAGKAHPLDQTGKEMIREWRQFIQQYELHDHVVFVSDYDISLAQELVQGVDVWINTPRYPMEACGTSGMKVLVNGGLNVSTLDGWWSQAFKPKYGWAIGDGQEHNGRQWDIGEAEQLYDCLEQEIIPEFYRRNNAGVPLNWLARMRASMAELAPEYSSNRMVRQYVEQIYLNSATRYHDRADDDSVIVRSLLAWRNIIRSHWNEIHWGDKYYGVTDKGFDIEVQVYLGSIPADYIQVQLYYEPENNEPAEPIVMLAKECLVGTVGGYVYRVHVETLRPSWHYTPRIIGWHQHAIIPCECNHILWWGA